MSENGHDDHIHSEDGGGTEGYAHAPGPGQPTHTHGPGGHSHSDAFAQKEGRWAQAAEERISLFRHDQEIEQGLAFGLPGSPTLVDRTIPTFSRGELPHFAGVRG